MIRFLTTDATLSDGLFQMELKEPCNCYVGLLEFHLPMINQRANNENTVDITCDQIDSSFDNPKRLLKRLCFDKVDDKDYYNHWEAKTIQFHKVDSTENYLTFRLSRTLGKKSIKFARSIENPQIFYTLAIKPITDKHDSWN